MCHCIPRIPEDMKMLSQTSVSQVSWNWNLCPQLSLCLMCHRLVKSWACYASKAEGGVLVRVAILLTGNCKTRVGDCILGGTTRDLMSVHNHVCIVWRDTYIADIVISSAVGLFWAGAVIEVWAGSDLVMIWLQHWQSRRPDYVNPPEWLTKKMDVYGFPRCASVIDP